MNSRRVITRVLMLCALFLVPRTSFGRNDFVGLPIHRVDVRVQKAIAIGHRSLAGIVDVFNVFNRANYGSYTLTETSASYGKPSYNGNLAYQARMVQFGFRVAF